MAKAFRFRICSIHCTDVWLILFMVNFVYRLPKGEGFGTGTSKHFLGKQWGRLGPPSRIPEEIGRYTSPMNPMGYFQEETKHVF